MRTLLLVTAFTALGTTAARADQCAINDGPIAAKAAALVKKGATVLEFCEPCNDRSPGTAYTVTTSDIRGGELYVNGKGIDLAYLYLQTRPDEFENVGRLTRCGATRVSESIVNGRPRGPNGRPPMPPMPPRVTGPDDFAGVWNVRITTQYSSCPKVAPQGTEQVRWVMTNTGPAMVLELPSGNKLTGAIDTKGSFQKSTLRSLQRPSATALSLSQFAKDTFSGTLIRAESIAGSPRDPICVVHQNIWARREVTP
ncbi:MAG: hypothetical protein ABI867_27310 [Kofleriaceae bacterium]